MQLTFTGNIDRYMKGVDSEDGLDPQLATRIAQRLSLMKDLAVKGSITLPAGDAKKHHDLVNYGIVRIDKYEPTKVTYDSLEPVMLFALYQYLKEEHNVDFTDLIVEWLNKIVLKLKNSPSKKEVSRISKEKGIAAEVLLADCLILVAKELAGRPLTDHELFADAKGLCPWLTDYTLKATHFEHDRSTAKTKGKTWHDLLLNKRTEVLCFPSENMGPDILGLLECIPGTESYKQYGPHCIPLTASSKLYQDPNEDEYTKNYRTTHLWDGFTRLKSYAPKVPEVPYTVRAADDDRATLLKLLEGTFGERKRCVRISFLFNPGNKIEKPIEDSMHFTFDYHYQPFIDTLERNSGDLVQLLKDCIKMK